MSNEQQLHVSTTEKKIPLLHISGPWRSILEGEARNDFEALLPDVLVQRRWFGAKGKQIEKVTIEESVAIPHDQTKSYLVLLRVAYHSGPPDLYSMVLSFSNELGESSGTSAVVELSSAEGRGVVYDAVRDNGLVHALLNMIGNGAELQGGIVAHSTAAFRELTDGASSLEPRVVGAEQSNTSIIFGDRLIMKLFRRVESGTNPDLEIGRFLTAQGFANTPPVAGAIELLGGGDERSTLAILQGFVANQGDAWKYTLESLQRSIREFARGDKTNIAIPDAPAVALISEEPPEALTNIAGEYFEAARLLGRRTGEMHAALNSRTDDESFAPEPYTDEFRDGMQVRMRDLAVSVLAQLRSHLHRMPAEIRGGAEELAQREDEIVQAYRSVLEGQIDAQRIRIHGDCHLGQVLYTGDDFVIIDFEGEPMRSIRERRVKQSALRDVAGMMRSFSYAAHTALAQSAKMNVQQGDKELLASFCAAWSVWSTAAFLDGYLGVVRGAAFLPHDPQQIHAMLDVFLLDKAVYELGYEINNRPAWISIPVAGITAILDERRRTEARPRRVA